MIRTKYVSKAKRERLEFRQSQPCAVPVKVEPDILWTKDHRMICGDTSNGKRLYDVIKDFMWIRDGGKCCICGEFVPWKKRLLSIPIFAAEATETTNRSTGETES
jgi:hypothetical protein